MATKEEKLKSKLKEEFLRFNKLQAMKYFLFVEEETNRWLGLLSEGHSSDIQLLIPPKLFCKLTETFLSVAKSASQLSYVCRFIAGFVLNSTEYSKILFTNSYFVTTLENRLMSPYGNVFELAFVFAVIFCLNKGASFVTKALMSSIFSSLCTMNTSPTFFIRICPGSSLPKELMALGELSCSVDVFCLLIFTIAINEALAEQFAVLSVHYIQRFLRDDTCSSRHAFLLEYVSRLLDTMKVNEITGNILKEIDFPLWLKFSFFPSKENMRAFSQLVLMDLMRMRDQLKSQGFKMKFPKTLTDICLTNNKRLLESEGDLDQIFALMMTAEYIKKEKHRQQVMASGCVELVCNVLERMSDFVEQANEPNCMPYNIQLQLIEASLSVIQRLVYTSEHRQKNLFHITPCVAQYIFHPVFNIQCLARSTCQNLIGRTPQAQMMLYKALLFERFIEDWYEFHLKYLSSEISLKLFSDALLPCLALLRNQLSCHQRTLSTCQHDASQSDFNLSEEMCLHINEMCSYSLELSCVAPSFHLLAVHNFTLLLYENMVVESCITNQALSNAQKCANNKVESFASSATVFLDLFFQRYPHRKTNLPLSPESNNTNLGTNNSWFGVKCSYPSCMVFGGAKLQNNLKLSKCARCRSVSYCGRSCQKLHWREHRTTCYKVQEEKGNMSKPD